MSRGSIRLHTGPYTHTAKRAAGSNGQKALFRVSANSPRLDSDNGAPLGNFLWAAIQCMVGKRKDWRTGGRLVAGGGRCWGVLLTNRLPCECNPGAPVVPKQTDTDSIIFPGSKQIIIHQINFPDQPLCKRLPASWHHEPHILAWLRLLAWRTCQDA